MVRIVAAALGLVLGANALFQLIAPLAWYDSVPGVIATGPFNAHFVRDIGAAQNQEAGAGRRRRLPDSACGDPRLRRGLRRAAAAGHDPRFRRRPPGGADHPRAGDRRPADLSQTRSPAVLKAILLRTIDHFERSWGYDASYMRALVRASTRMKFR
jgi:hypothetical protein